MRRNIPETLCLCLPERKWGLPYFASLLLDAPTRILHQTEVPLGVLLACFARSSLLLRNDLNYERSRVENAKTLAHAPKGMRGVRSKKSDAFSLLLQVKYQN